MVKNSISLEDVVGTIKIIGGGVAATLFGYWLNYRASMRKQRLPEFDAVITWHKEMLEHQAKEIAALKEQNKLLMDKYEELIMLRSK